MAMAEWTVIEIEEGKFRVSNEDVEIEISRDFSGNVTNAAGEFMEFSDLRDFIRAAKLLETALIEHYGGWE